MKKTLIWIGARLTEPSTWAGLGTIATCVTIFATTVADSLGTGGKSALIGALITGVIAVVKRENGGS